MSGNAHFSRIYSNTTASAVKPAFVSPETNAVFVPSSGIGPQFCVFSTSMQLEVSSEQKDRVYYKLTDHKVPKGTFLNQIVYSHSLPLANRKANYYFIVVSPEEGVDEVEFDLNDHDKFNLTASQDINSSVFMLATEKDNVINGTEKNTITVDLYYITPPS